jgi:hypothetical protein
MAAARVVQADLALAANHLQHIVQRDQRWFGFYTFALPHWDLQEALLARSPSAEDWEVVSQSALELTRHEEGMRRLVEPGSPAGGCQRLAAGQRGRPTGTAGNVGERLRGAPRAGQTGRD